MAVGAAGCVILTGTMRGAVVALPVPTTWNESARQLLAVC